MIKYFCDRCGKETKIEDSYRIPPRMKNESGIMHHGGFLICIDCYHRWREVLDRVSDLDFVRMTDDELEPYRCDFKVGDEVITNDGRVGEIVNICTCKRCRERGFFESTVELNDGSTYYITIYDREDGFSSYYKIGNHIFGNLNIDAVRNEVKAVVKRHLQLNKQLLLMESLKDAKEMHNGH